MKRYLFFLSLALLLHGLFLIPLFVATDSDQPAVGGGAGATISISMEPVTAEDEGLHKVTPQQARTKSRGFDTKQSSQSGAGTGPSAGPGKGSGSSTAGLDDILAQIRSRIERAKRYPLMARRRGLEGTSDVSFRILENGTVSGLKLARSSGSSPLDEAALATIRRAAPFPYYPKAIRIGIRFALNKKKD